MELNWTQSKKTSNHTYLMTLGRFWKNRSTRLFASTNTRTASNATQELRLAALLPGKGKPSSPQTILLSKPFLWLWEWNQLVPTVANQSHHHLRHIWTSLAVAPRGTSQMLSKSQQLYTYTFFFSFLFYNCTVPLGLLLWEIWVAFLGESQMQHSCTIQPMIHTGCFSVSIIHQDPT